MIQRLVPSAAATRPSSVAANFQMTNGPVLADAGAASARQGAVLGLGLLDAELDVDPGRAQPVGAAAGELGRVGDGDDDAGDAGGDQRVGAGAGAAGVRARLEGDDGGAAAGPLAGLRPARRPRRAGRRAAPSRPPPPAVPSASRTTAPTGGFGLVVPSAPTRRARGRAAIAARSAGVTAHPRVAAAACARRAAIAFAGSSAP